MGTMHAAPTVPAVLQWLLPSLIIAYFLVAEAANLCMSSSPPQRNNERPRHVISVLQGTILATYGAEALTLAVDALCCGATGNIYTLLSVIVWTILFARFHDGENSMPCFPIWGSWVLSVISEMLLLTLRLPLEHAEAAGISRVILQSLRLMILVLLLQYRFHQTPAVSGQMVDESTPFLGQTGANSMWPKIDRLSTHKGEENASTTYPQKIANEEPRREREETGGNDCQLISIVRASANIYSFLRNSFPRHSSLNVRLLRLHSLGLLLNLCAQRALIVVLSLQLGHITDSLSQDIASSNVVPSGLLVSFLACLYLAGPGFLGRFEDLCVTFLREQGEMSIKTAVHLRASESSEDFEDEGTCVDTDMMLKQAASLVKLLESVVLRSLPCLLDVVIGHVVLLCVLGRYAFLTMLLFDILHLWAMVRLHKRRFSSQLVYSGAEPKEAGEWSLIVGKRNSDTCSRGFSLGGDYTANTSCAPNRVLTLSNCVHLRYSTLQSVLVLSCLVSVLIIVVYQIMHGSQTIGQFVMLIYYFQKIFGHLDSFSFPSSKQYHWLADARALYASFGMKPTVLDGPHLFNFVRGEIAFENVGFSYDGKRRILDDLTFRIKPEHQVALIGDPGCGKTTILRLLCRTYDVQSGKIIIDGQDLRDLTRDSLRSCIGIVPQEVPIFDCSIMENVRRGYPQASDDEVIEACKSATIHEQILTKVEGYNAQVGKRGHRLSGAEKKKIGIARVFLKNPRIVLLDDTSGSFDTGTDLSIRKTIQRLIFGRTALFTACRLASARNVDVLLLNGSGCIAKQDAPKLFLESNNDSPGSFKQPSSIESPITPRARTKLPTSQVSSQKGKTRGSRPTNEKGDASASKFKPDAPEFVPNYQRGTEASNSQASHAHPSSGHQTSRKDSNTVHPYGSGQTSASASNDRLAEKRPQKPQTGINESDKTPLKSIEEASLAKAKPDYDGPADRASATKKPHMNRWHRRRQARSDPPGTAVGSGEVEEKKQVQSTSSSKAREAPRHTSGPGQLPTGHMAEPKIFSNAVDAIDQAPRPRRQRYLRIRKQHGTAASRSKINTNEPYATSSNATESSSTLTSNTVVASGESHETPTEQGRECAG